MGTLKARRKTTSKSSVSSQHDSPDGNAGDATSIPGEENALVRVVGQATHTPWVHKELDTT